MEIHVIAFLQIMLRSNRLVLNPQSSLLNPNTRLLRKFIRVTLDF